MKNNELPSLPDPEAYLYINGDQRGVSLHYRSDSEISEGTSRIPLITADQAVNYVRAVLQPTKPCRSSVSHKTACRSAKENQATEPAEPVKLTRDTDMAETRNVLIHLDATERTQMQNATDHNEWFRAIGYLSTWNMSFPTVVIHADGETDMVAVYRDEDDRIRYVIGAVWHDDHYGFHS